MSLAALKLFLISRLFLGTTGTLAVILASIAFNWFDAYHLVRSGLTTAVEWTDILHDWGTQAKDTYQRVEGALDKAQKELDSSR